MTGTSSWMMMEAVMYGYTPMEAMLKLRSAPPLKMFRNPRSWSSWKTLSN